jgi:1,4-alpha-glucan branching enzyme
MTSSFSLPAFPKNSALVWMLHTHLPYYRKAGTWPFGEENLFECLAESYLPLWVLLETLVEEGLSPKLTLGVTPVLLEQLRDAYLIEGAQRYLERKCETAKAEIVRWKHEPALFALAERHLLWFEQRLQWLTQRFQGDLLTPLKRLLQQGHLDCVASAATHAFLPLLKQQSSIDYQMAVGKETFESVFSQVPKGFWLPECAYRPHQKEWNLQGLEVALERFGFDYCFTEHHALGASSDQFFSGGFPQSTAEVLGANPSSGSSSSSIRSELGTHQAYWLEGSRVAVLGRNHQACFQVWSSHYGYPGDGHYLEFYRTDPESGLRYWALTDKTLSLESKALYNPQQAKAKAQEHAHHFVSVLQEIAQAQSDDVSAGSGGQNLTVLAFDTELFGHWWHEGVDWLETVLRQLSKASSSPLQTPSRYLQVTPPQQSVVLPECTWGQGGHYWVWSNKHVDWMWLAIHELEETFQALVQKHGGTQNPLVRRTLNQMGREVMLMQASDWPFLVTTFQAKDYAIQRFETHRANAVDLANQLKTQFIQEETLKTLEATNCLFPAFEFDKLKNAT